MSWWAYLLYARVVCLVARVWHGVTRGKMASKEMGEDDK